MSICLLLPRGLTGRHLPHLQEICLFKEAVCITPLIPSIPYFKVFGDIDSTSRPVAKIAMSKVPG